jgi:hypothetical protein
VTRFGQRAYKLPRLEYWATYRWMRGGPGVWKTGQERWNAVPRDPISDTPPTWLRVGTVCKISLANKTP